MINKLLLPLAMLLLATAQSLGAAPEKAHIKFNDKSYDFGVISNDAPVSHEFEFVNDSEANLVILDAKSECGCTKPVFPKAPIPPGKKGRIKVTFNPAGFRGFFEKNVTVVTNGSPKKTKLKIKGSVR